MARRGRCVSWCDDGSSSARIRRGARLTSSSPSVSTATRTAGKLGLEALDFGRRAATERDLQATTVAAIRAFLAPPPPPGAEPPAAASSGRGGSKPPPPAAAGATGPGATSPASQLVPPSNAVFDESGYFLIYPTLLGIKVVNTVTNQVGSAMCSAMDGTAAESTFASRVRATRCEATPWPSASAPALGATLSPAASTTHDHHYRHLPQVRAVLGRVEESERFLCLALFQGVPRISSQFALARDAAAGASSGWAMECPSGTPFWRR
jgi:hypothetical protein